MAGQNPNIEKQAAAEGLDQRYKSLCCLEKMRKKLKILIIYNSLKFKSTFIPFLLVLSFSICQN
jgi:hypothetical protein